MKPIEIMSAFGHGLLNTQYRQQQEEPMAAMTHAQQREYNAKQRRLQKDRARLQREQRRAQRYLQALEHALGDLALPTTLVEEVQWRLQAQVKLLGKIFGVMGCIT